MADVHGGIPHLPTMNVRALPVYGIVGLALIIVGVGVWRTQPDPSVPMTGAPLLAVVMLALGAVFCMLAQILGPAYLAALAWFTPILPAFAAVGTVIAYVGGLAVNGQEAVVYGFITLALACFALGIIGLDKTKARGAQERAFGELQVRLQQLNGRLRTIAPTMDGQPAFAETMATLQTASDDLYDAEPGPQWASATGYVTLWRAVHRTEEALIDVDTETAVVAGALVDDLRLDGSAIPGRDRLVQFLRGAVAELDPAAAHIYLPQAQQVAAHKAEATSDVEIYRARAMLREVHRAINEFRDARMEDIVRTRNILRRTFGFAAIVSYALLAVAVLLNTPRELIASGTGLFLLAALVGLFSRLRNSSVAQSTVDDFGLYEAQLLAGPLVSGIAGLGGVILIAAAPIAAAALSTVNAPALGAGTVPTLDFASIFDLSKNPLAVVFAAIFGLTPDLLLSRLQAETDKLKKDIRSSYVADKVEAGSAPRS